MLTLQVVDLGPLRNAISPLLILSNFADFKCSPKSISLTVSYPAQIHSFASVLRIFDPFFTIFSSGPDADAHTDYRSRIHLSDFFWHILDEDFYLTILIPKVFSSLNVLSSTSYGVFQSFATLMTIPSEKEEVGRFDLKLFVAIDAEKFREIVRGLPEDKDDPVLVTASTSQVRFSALRRSTANIAQIVLTSQGRECLAGGFDERVSEIRFSFAPTPKGYFIEASESSKLVWFFGSSDWPTTVICFTTQWTNLVACYPASSSSLLHSFALCKIR